MDYSVYKKAINDNSGIVKVWDGETLSSKNKTVSVKIVLTEICFYLLTQPRFKSEYSIYQAISIIDLKKIEFINETTIHLYRRRYDSEDEIKIHSSDVSTICLKINELSYRICFNSKFFQPISFISFPIKFTNQFQDFKEYPNIITLRYQSLCLTYNQPIDPHTYNLLSEFENGPRISLFFKGNDGLASPYNSVIISKSLGDIPTLQIVSFDSYAPNCICKIVHELLQYSKSIQSIYLSNYLSDEFKPLQLNFENLRDPSCISFSFSNLKLDTLSTNLFFNQIKNYPGSLQQFYLSSMNLNKESFPFICSLFNSPCFKSLEDLHISHIKTEKEDEIALTNIFTSNLFNLSCLVRLTLLDCASQITININNCGEPNKIPKLIVSQTIRHLFLSSVNLININNGIEFPPLINEIKFNSCSFTAQSLLSFCKSIKQIKRPITLGLNKLVISKDDLSLFFQMVDKEEPMENIIDFVWNDTPISPEVLSSFRKFFINPKVIRFLNLSNSFKVNNLNCILQVLSDLSESTCFWGFEMNANENTRFGDNILQVMEKLASFRTLEHISLTGHRFSIDTAKKIAQICNQMAILHEVDFDDCGLSLTDLYTFYDSLFLSGSLRCIHPPLEDFTRLYNEANSLISHGSEIPENIFFLTEKEYLAMVRCKTGTLASLAAKLGCLAGGLTVSQAQAFSETAADIGIGFQIIDDVINLTTGNVGKKRGDDIVEGKKSLPVLIHAHLQPADKTLIAAFMKEAAAQGIDSPSVEKCIALLEKSGCIKKAAERGRSLIEESCAAFNSEPIRTLFTSMIPENFR